MHEAFADRICGGLPGADREQPFGPGMVVWTIDGHMFAAYTEGGEGLSVRTGDPANGTIKRDGEAHQGADQPGADWVLVSWATPPETLRLMVGQSYRMVLKDRNGASHA